MKAKATVLAKQQSAECIYCGVGTYVIDTPSRRRRAQKFLGSGKTPSAAWANAALHIKSAPLERRIARLLAKAVRLNAQANRLTIKAHGLQ